jgi:hypothetical protein
MEEEQKSYNSIFKASVILGAVIFFKFLFNSLDQMLFLYY